MEIFIIFILLKIIKHIEKSSIIQRWKIVSKKVRASILMDLQNQAIMTLNLGDRENLSRT